MLKLWRNELLQMEVKENNEIYIHHVTFRKKGNKIVGGIYLSDRNVGFEYEGEIRRIEIVCMEQLVEIAYHRTNLFVLFQVNDTHFVLCRLEEDKTLTKVAMVLKNSEMAFLMDGPLIGIPMVDGVLDLFGYFTNDVFTWDARRVVFEQVKEANCVGCSKVRMNTFMVGWRNEDGTRWFQVLAGDGGYDLNSCLQEVLPEDNEIVGVLVLPKRYISSVYASMRVLEKTRMVLQVHRGEEWSIVFLENGIPSNTISMKGRVHIMKYGVLLGVQVLVVQVETSVQVWAVKMPNALIREYTDVGWWCLENVFDNVLENYLLLLPCKYVLQEGVRIEKMVRHYRIVQDSMDQVNGTLKMMKGKIDHQKSKRKRKMVATSSPHVVSNQHQGQVKLAVQSLKSRIPVAKQKLEKSILHLDEKRKLLSRVWNMVQALSIPKTGVLQHSLDSEISTFDTLSPICAAGVVDKVPLQKLKFERKLPFDYQCISHAYQNGRAQAQVRIKNNNDSNLLITISIVCFRNVKIQSISNQACIAPNEAQTLPTSADVYIVDPSNKHRFGMVSIVWNDPTTLKNSFIVCEPKQYIDDLRTCASLPKLGALQFEVYCIANKANSSVQCLPKLLEDIAPYCTVHEVSNSYAILTLCVNNGFEKARLESYLKEIAKSHQFVLLPKVNSNFVVSLIAQLHQQIRTEIDLTILLQSQTLTKEKYLNFIDQQVHTDRIIENLNHRMQELSVFIHT